MNKNRGIYIFLFVILLVLLGYGAYSLYKQGVLFGPRQNTKEEDVQEVKDIELKTKEGLTFTLSSPLPKSELGCTFLLSGKMPREWFFENVFPYRIEIEGVEVVRGLVQSHDDYTVKEMLTFSQELECIGKCLGNSEIILRRDNPSGLEENDDEYRIPVKFTQNCEKPETLED